MTATVNRARGMDWLGFPCPFTQPAAQVVITRDRHAAATLGELLTPQGEATARESTDVALWYDQQAIHLRVRCHTAAMERVRKLAASPKPFSRDVWGDDAVEVQFDPEGDGNRFVQLSFEPSGRSVTYRGSSNRLTQGWRPPFEFQATLEPGAWVIQAALPFTSLLGPDGKPPADGAVWGFNLTRVNPSEPTGYVQWAPTFGDALLPALLGKISFAGSESVPPRGEQRAAYGQRFAQRRAYFQAAINSIDDAMVLAELGVADWQAWARHIEQRPGPLPLRWEGLVPGVAGIPQVDRPIAMALAEETVARVASWQLDPPEPASFHSDPVEALADAFLLTGDQRYARAFERFIAVHDALLKQMLAKIDMPAAHSGANSPYHDAQITRAAILAYAYLTLAPAGLSLATHAAMMRALLRAARFAAFNVSTLYAYGNHQVYESSGLATAALLFPEFRQSAQWAQIAGRAIGLHLEREVNSDGGYQERCIYHSVAMTFAMHPVTGIIVNNAQSRFAELMSPAVQSRLRNMHRWVLQMLAPDGTLPAFGDFSAHSHLRFLQRGAAVFGAADLLWLMQQIAPSLAPPGMTPAEPGFRSVTQEESQFTVMRSGWTTDAAYMAVDHGPLGGQHSHVDTMGFAAYAYGQPLAVDTGIGVSYSDPNYLSWYRQIRAHNVVAVDDAEPEKVAQRTSWHAGKHADFLAMRSGGYEHAYGLTHERRILFIKEGIWLIYDRLSGARAAHDYDWLLHTPLPLQADGAAEAAGRCAQSQVGMLVLAGATAGLAEPRLAKRPASVALPAVAALRVMDACRLRSKDLLREVTELTWRKRAAAGAVVEFATVLLPYRGERPAAVLERIEAGPAAGWSLTLGGGRRLVFFGAQAAGEYRVGPVTFAGRMGAAELTGPQTAWLEQA